MFAVLQPSRCHWRSWVDAWYGTIWLTVGCRTYTGCRYRPCSRTTLSVGSPPRRAAPRHATPSARQTFSIRRSLLVRDSWRVL